MQYSDDISFSNNDSYILSFNAHANNLTNSNVRLSNADIELNVYGIGDAFGSVPKLLDSLSAKTAKNYIGKEIEFIPDVSGSGKIRFEIPRGI